MHDVAFSRFSLSDRLGGFCIVSNDTPDVCGSPLFSFWHTCVSKIPARSFLYAMLYEWFSSPVQLGYFVFVVISTILSV